MKKFFSLFIIISLLIVLISGCENIILQNNDGELEQGEGDSAETGTSPGPAPNSGDGVSDGSGWEYSPQE